MKPDEPRPDQGSNRHSKRDLDAELVVVVSGSTASIMFLPFFGVVSTGNLQQ